MDPIVATRFGMILSGKLEFETTDTKIQKDCAMDVEWPDSKLLYLYKSVGGKSFIPIDRLVIEHRIVCFQ